MRLIDADAVAAKITAEKEENKPESNFEVGYWNGLTMAHAIILAAPTIEEKHGRWLPQMLLGQRAWDCSECATLGSPHWKRCPVCEAQKDLEG